MRAQFSSCQTIRHILTCLVLIYFCCAEIHSNSATDIQRAYLHPKIFFCENKYLAYLPKAEGPKSNTGSRTLSDSAQIRAGSCFSPRLLASSSWQLREVAGLQKDTRTWGAVQWHCPCPHAGLMLIIYLA